MIIYNNRYRGPFEYEKFLLNILSFHNIINEINTYENDNIIENFNSVISLKNDIEEIYNTFVGDNSISSSIYDFIVENKEGIVSI